MAQNKKVHCFRKKNKILKLSMLKETTEALSFKKGLFKDKHFIMSW
jgi:hypothetical protein